MVKSGLKEGAYKLNKRLGFECGNGALPIRCQYRHLSKRVVIIQKKNSYQIGMNGIKKMLSASENRIRLVI
jgi:hypothetical protein